MASSLEALLGQIRKLQQGNPYDSGLANALQQAQYQMSDLDRMYAKGRGEIQSGYDTETRTLGKQRDAAVENTEDSFADRGTLFSGIHAAEQGKVQEGYQSGMTNAAQRRLGSLNQLDENRLGSENAIQAMLRGAQGDYTNRQQQSARDAAALQAQREAVAQQAAQQAALQRQMIAAMNSMGGGIGGTPAVGTGPRTGLVDAGMMGSQYQVMDPQSYDAYFNALKNDPVAAQKFLTENQRYGGQTLEQRQYMTAAQRRLSMTSRRNQ